MVRATWPRHADWMTSAALLTVRYLERAFSMRTFLWMVMAARRRHARRASALASMPLAPACRHRTYCSKGQHSMHSTAHIRPCQHVSSTSLQTSNMSQQGSAQPSMHSTACTAQHAQSSPYTQASTVQVPHQTQNANLVLPDAKAEDSGW